MKLINKPVKSIAIVSTLAVLLSGCSATSNLFGKRDNGSLDYQESKLLAPLQIPVQTQHQPFISMYPVADLGESPINIVNESGAQYELPKPRKAGN